MARVFYTGFEGPWMNNNDITVNGYPNIDPSILWPGAEFGSLDNGWLWHTGSINQWFYKSDSGRGLWDPFMATTTENSKDKGTVYVGYQADEKAALRFNANTNGLTNGFAALWWHNVMYRDGTPAGNNVAGANFCFIKNNNIWYHLRTIGDTEFAILTSSSVNSITSPIVDRWDSGVSQVATTEWLPFHVRVYSNGGNLAIEYGGNGLKQVYTNSEPLSVVDYVYFSSRDHNITNGNGCCAIDDFGLNNSLSAFPGDPNTNMRYPDVTKFYNWSAYWNADSSSGWEKIGTQQFLMSSVGEALLDYSDNTRARSSEVGQNITITLNSNISGITTMDESEFNDIAAVNILQSKLKGNINNTSDLKVSVGNHGQVITDAPVVYTAKGLSFFHSTSASGGDFTIQSLTAGQLDVKLDTI